MTDDLLDELYRLLFLGEDGPLLDSRMALEPDLSAASYFIAAPRPSLSAEDMARPSQIGLMAELRTVLDDLPEARRDEVIAKIETIIGLLTAASQSDTAAEPSSLKYALH